MMVDEYTSTATARREVKKDRPYNKSKSLKYVWRRCTIVSSRNASKRTGLCSNRPGLLSLKLYYKSAIHFETTSLATHTWTVQTLPPREPEGMQWSHKRVFSSSYNVDYLTSVTVVFTQSANKRCKAIRPHSLEDYVVHNPSHDRSTLAHNEETISVKIEVEWKTTTSSH